jgi:hypothetical protein
MNSGQDSLLSNYAHTARTCPRPPLLTGWNRSVRVAAFGCPQRAEQRSFVIARMKGSCESATEVRHRTASGQLRTLGHPGQRALERRLTIREGTVALQMVADDPRRSNRLMRGLPVAHTSTLFKSRNHATGATDAPTMPCLAKDAATNPDAFTSSTNCRRTSRGGVTAALRSSHCLLNHNEALVEQSKPKRFRGIRLELLFDAGCHLLSLFNQRLNHSWRRKSTNNLRVL